MGGSEDGPSALSSIVCGSVAGMTAKIFEHPFDLVKVRLQSQPTDRPLTFKGPFDCFKRTYLGEGIKGLYRGISMPILGAAAENATLFLVYTKCQDAIVYLNPHPSTGLRSDPLSGSIVAAEEEKYMSEKKKGKRREMGTGELAIAAAGAGAAASFVLTPIELIKCRMQVQMFARESALAAAADSSRPSGTSGSYASTSDTHIKPLGSRPISTSSILCNSKAPLSAASLPPLEGPVALTLNTIRSHGIRGLWLGQTGTFLRETGGSSAWFTTYEVVAKFFLGRRQSALDASSSSSSSLVSPAPAKRLTKGDLATHELMLSGASAGIMYNVTLFPADSIKSAIQTAAELNPTAKRMGFVEMGKSIWRTRGIRGLYAGCGMTCLRSGPSSAIIFLLYETLEKHIGGYLN